MHLIWNLTTLIIILTFLLGAIFGIAGIISKDGVPVFKYLFSAQNLMYDGNIVNDKTVGSMINTCVNCKIILFNLL